MQYTCFREPLLPPVASTASTTLFSMRRLICTFSGAAGVEGSRGVEHYQLSSTRRDRQTRKASTDGAYTSMTCTLHFTASDVYLCFEQLLPRATLPPTSDSSGGSSFMM